LRMALVGTKSKSPTFLKIYLHHALNA